MIGMREPGSPSLFSISGDCLRKVRLILWSDNDAPGVEKPQHRVKITRPFYRSPGGDDSLSIAETPDFAALV